MNLEKIERCLQKIKKGTLPKTPETVDEIVDAFSRKDVIESYGTALQTVDGHGVELKEKYMFFDGAFENKKKQFSFCAFSSKATIKLIESHIPVAERHISMDATFRIVPVGKFKQLLILYIRKNKKVILFVLLSHFMHAFVSCFLPFSVFSLFFASFVFVHFFRFCFLL